MPPPRVHEWRCGFQQGNWLVPVTGFEGRMACTVDYATSGDAFVRGDSTTTYSFGGCAITAATQLVQ